LRPRKNIITEHGNEVQQLGGRMILSKLNPSTAKNKNKKQKTKHIDKKTHN
jgi:hypothetical protein